MQDKKGFGSKNTIFVGSTVKSITTEAEPPQASAQICTTTALPPGRFLTVLQVFTDEAMQNNRRIHLTWSEATSRSSEAG